MVFNTPKGTHNFILKFPCIVIQSFTCGVPQTKKADDAFI